MLTGLSSEPKTLSSKYFYDDEGDKIFQEIMEMEEYYLPQCELEIIDNSTVSIAKQIPSTEIDIIELGAGDGVKTVHFLKELMIAGKKVKYVPLDISASVLETNKFNILQELPELNIEPIAGDYFETMTQLESRNTPKLVLFLGSNIGNFKGQRGVDFLHHVREHMVKGDQLLIGADLKKNPKTILAAYNDKNGITARFNLNLLKRMNRELNANFDLNQFEHYPYYNPVSGTCYSYLVSLQEQNVSIGEESIRFEKNECIHTEVSQKYDLSDLEELTSLSGFTSFIPFQDKKEWYCLGLATV